MKPHTSLLEPDAPIHNYDKRLAAYKRIIQTLPNGKTTLCFLDHLGALNLSVARVAKYASHLPALLRLFDVDLKAITKTDIEAIVANIHSSKYKEWTKHDKKLTLRKLVQYAKESSCTKDTPLPLEVKWISLNIKEKDPRVTPQSLLTPEEFIEIIKAATNKRDKALVSVLFEAALRPGELLTMHTCSVTFKEEYCLISTNGKTGIKHIPLVVSCKPLLEWLEEHPFRDEPDAPLWCSLSSNSEGKRLSYVHFRCIIKRLARKAGIKKDIWPYLYRYTSLTAMAKVFTEARLEQFAGWTYGSKMTRRYVHFSARDLEDAILELHGLKTASKDLSIVKLLACSRCGNKNAGGTVRCTSCGMVMDKKTVLKIDETERQQVETLGKKNRDLQTRIEKLEGAISTLMAAQDKL